jgi:uncharacterized protein (DUF736 family)
MIRMQKGRALDRPFSFGLVARVGSDHRPRLPLHADYSAFPCSPLPTARPATTTACILSPRRVRRPTPRSFAAPFRNARKKLFGFAPFFSCRSAFNGHRRSRGNKTVIVTVSNQRRLDMIIGSFIHDATQDTYQGDILTLNFAATRVTFTPNKKNGDKTPDYRITAATAGAPVELGAGWKRESEKGQNFVSVTLDGPLMAAPVNAALFEDDDGKASLVWSRQKGKAKSDTAKKAT